MNTNEVKQPMKDKLRSFLVAHRATADVGEFADGDSLLELGVIDSLSMVDLIAHLEKSYSIGVDEDDMIPENFDSIDAIVSYLEQKRGEDNSSVGSSPATN